MPTTIVSLVLLSSIGRVPYDDLDTTDEAMFQADC